MTQDPVPQRLSDAERDAAASMLREHFEAGRLDQAEFDERLTRALGARYATDFDALFSDLPDPHPTGSAAVSPWTQPELTGWTAPIAPAPARTPGGTDWLGVARGAIWPVAILMCFVTGNWGLFIAIAIVGSIVLGQLARNQRKPPPYLDERQPPPGIGG